MQRVLFHSTIFGPIRSRRLGLSLGINLLPDDGKICSFDCLYCEAGFNAQGFGTTGFPPVEKVLGDLEKKLKETKDEGETPDVITFSGNGEPTLHPKFPEIIDGVIALRDKYSPKSAISVLTNSTTLGKPEIVEALKKIENPILKLDSTVDSTIRLIDRPNSPDFSFEKVKEKIKSFGEKAIVQVMILKGKYEGKTIDNATEAETDGMTKALKEINPRSVMLYSIDRPTPHKDLTRVGKEDLERIADKMRKAGIRNVTTA